MRNGPQGAHWWDVERQRARRLGGQRQPSRGSDPQRWDVERQRARNLDEQRQSTRLDPHALDVARAPRRK